MSDKEFAFLDFTFDPAGNASTTYDASFSLELSGNLLSPNAGGAVKLDNTPSAMGIYKSWSFSGQIDGDPHVLEYYFLGFGNASVVVDVALTPTSPVPEPQTYAMLLAGLGMLGFMGKRRKTQ